MRTEAALERRNIEFGAIPSVQVQSERGEGRGGVVVVVGLVWAWKAMRRWFAAGVWAWAGVG